MRNKVIIAFIKKIIHMFLHKDMYCFYFAVCLNLSLKANESFRTKLLKTCKEIPIRYAFSGRLPPCDGGRSRRREHRDGMVGAETGRVQTSQFPRAHSNCFGSNERKNRMRKTTLWFRMTSASLSLIQLGARSFWKPLPRAPLLTDLAQLLREKAKRPSLSFVTSHQFYRYELCYCVFECGNISDREGSPSVFSPKLQMMCNKKSNELSSRLSTNF